MARPIVVRRSVRHLQNDIAAALDTLGRGALPALAGRRVLIKANFNSPHRYPASTAPGFLAALAGALRDAGAGRIAIGDSCGLRWAPAERVAAALGIPQLAKQLDAEWINFDDGPWREVRVGGELFPVVRVAEAFFQADFVLP